jgi:hypothetical protein
MHKLVPVLHNVRGGIPQQLGQQIRAQRSHFPIAARRIIALLKQTRHPVLHKKLNVRLQGLEVRKRLLIMPKIRCVIPNVEFWRDRLPRNDVIAKPFVLRGRAALQRMRKTTLDRAEPHDHVLPRSQRFRRLSRILIRQRVNPHLRIIVLNVLGNCVHKLQQRCGWTPLRVIQRLAGFTLAPLRRIIL